MLLWRQVIEPPLAPLPEVAWIWGHEYGSNLRNGCSVCSSDWQARMVSWDAALDLHLHSHLTERDRRRRTLVFWVPWFLSIMKWLICVGVSLSTGTFLCPRSWFLLKVKVTLKLKTKVLQTLHHAFIDYFHYFSNIFYVYDLLFL